MRDRDGSRNTMDEALQALPIFPLPGTVFFPHTLLPLHVFEPRYRQMTEQVIAGHQYLAVALIEQGGRDGAPEGCAPVGGLGRVVYHERLADGRFHILLQGIARVSLGAELPQGDLLYRRVKAAVIESDIADADADAIATHLGTLRGCYARLSNAHPECKDTLGDLPLRLDEPAVLADLVLAALLEDVALRQASLEEKRLVRRLEKANDVLATALLRTLPAEAGVLH